MKLPMTYGILLSILLTASQLRAQPQPGDYSPAKHEVLEELDQTARVRDGAGLMLDIFRPKEAGRFPAILQQTPYNKSGGAARARRFAARGYVVVNVDSRGRFRSEGNWDPFSPSHKTDGYDLVEWVAKQPWCTGKVGTYGLSYMGWTQWWTATQAPPSLKAMVPEVAPPDHLLNCPYQNGILVCWMVDWAGTMSGRLPHSAGPGPYGGFAVNREAAYRHTPYIDFDKSRHYLPTDWWRKWMTQNTSAGEYWREIAYQSPESYARVTVPSLAISGWFDANFAGTPLNYLGMKEHGGSPLARRPRMVIGPWEHIINSRREAAGVDFGPQAIIDWDGYVCRWFDYHLKGIDNGVLNDPPIHLFVMGRNEWRTASDWPLPETQFTKYFLHSGGHANSSSGDGTLSTTPPGAEEPDRYSYDPEDPTPSAGFTNGHIDGPRDIRTSAARQDVVVYTTAELTEPVELIGPITAKLFAATSARDTDWMIRLTDVFPDGRSLFLGEGVMRARHRDPQRGGAFNGAQLSAMNPNEAYEYTIDFWRPTGNQFARGHRIRIEISSSYYPYYLRNLNTGEDNLALAKDPVVARQTILHDSQHPSHVVLPVIPIVGTKKDAAEPDYAAELPKIAPKSPEDSRKAIRLKAGFHAELVATEPLIRSPMAMDFDEFGRAYVVELPEYNQYGSARPHGTGAVKRLEDTDGDGRFDQATVFVDQLAYPTAVACWDGGILVGVAPDILFCRDNDGDGKADVRQKLFTGFGQDKAGEGMLNSFRWRIDNRFHIPTGLDGGEIVPVQNMETGGAKPINARGQHLLLEPRRMKITATSGGGQHGMSLDDWNLHGFVCGNSEPVHLIMYDGRYVARNPYLQAPAAAVNIAPDGKFTKLMRVSPIEPWRVLRTRLRKEGTIPGSDEGGTPSGFFTGATGITVYRGDAWPAEFRGELFVGEVANNLVYRARVEPNGVGLVARRADPDAEFLASTDNWFRPVQFANAPDGTLYVLDMYRELIEGAAFLAPQILKHMDPSAGADQGRIYRIAPDGFRFTPPPRLGDLPSVELVKFLEHANGWHRDTASRLIYQRQDRASVAPLRALATTSPSPLARVMALYSLQGLDALETDLVVQACQSTDPRLREHALRLSESFAEKTEQTEIREAVLHLAADPVLRVRYQAAFTLGAFSGEQAIRALQGLSVRDGTDPWMQLAILSSVGERRAEFLAALLSDQAARESAHVRALLNILASQIGAANARDELAVFLQQLNRLADHSRDKLLAVELVRNLVAKQPAAGAWLSSTAEGKVKEILAAMIRDAQSTARDEKKSPADRASAVKTLATAKFADVQEVLAELLQSRHPQPVQVAALEALARFENAEVPAMIIAAWPSQTPPLRATSIETLFSRSKWIAAMLDAVESQTIARAEVDPARVALLQQHKDAAIRARAMKLFGQSRLTQRQEVVDAYQKALELPGNTERGRTHFRKVCAACHKLEGFGESIGADLNAIRDRGTAAVLLNILDPNREVKPQFFNYVVVLDSGRTLTGMIAAESANGLTIRKADNTSETILRINIQEIRSTGLSFMPEGLEKQLDLEAMADVLAYLNAVK